MIIQPQVQIVNDVKLNYNLQVALKNRHFKINQNCFQDPNGFKIPTAVVINKYGVLIEGGLDETIIFRQKHGKVYN